MTSLVIENAIVLDVVSGTYAERDLVIIDGRVVDPTEAKNLRAGSILRIDAAGRFVLPGLIDCHVHVVAAEADLSIIRTWPRSYLAMRAASSMQDMLDRGFTTVRDLGGADHGLARAQREGYLVGPRLAFCGQPLSQTGGHGDDRGPGDDHCWTTGLSQVVDGVDAVRRATRNELRRGADHIKVMASGGIASPTDRITSTQYSMEELRAIVQEAQAAERYVAAHAYTPESIDRALRAGVRSIEHGNLISQENIGSLRDNKGFLVMNLVAYEAISSDGRKQGMPENMVAKVRTVLDQGYEALEAAARGGVNVCFGSDLLGGLQQYQSREFAIRKNLQPAIEVIRGATSVAAELLQWSGLVGTLAHGAFGDAILVDRDPLDDVAVLADSTQISGVIQGGCVIRERSLT